MNRHDDTVIAASSKAAQANQRMRSVLTENRRAEAFARAPLVRDYCLSSKVSSWAALDGVIKTQSISCFSLFGAAFVLM
jgi:hypothetical protein